MGKAIQFMLVITGLMLLFYFTGLIQATPNTTLLNLLLSPENLATSGLNIALFAVLSLEGITALIIGAVTRDLELSLMAGYVVFQFNLFWDSLVIFNVIRNANPILAILIFAPLYFVWFTIAAEQWRGID